jgi:hypothetical protein
LFSVESLIPQGLSCATPEDIAESEKLATVCRKSRVVQEKKRERQEVENARKEALAEERRRRGEAIARDRRQRDVDEDIEAENDDLDFMGGMFA